MSARIIIASMAVFALACSNANGGANAPACTDAAPSVVFHGLDAYDALSVKDGFVYVELPGTGVQRCATTGCLTPTSVVDSQAFVSAALGNGGVAYTTQIAGADGTIGGEIRSVNVDGTSDQSLLGGLTYPAYIGTSGTLAFWADDSFANDDTPATINCVGCTGSGSSPWITGLGGGTYGMIADTANVYVLADNATLTSVQLLACSVHTACFSEPRVLIADLDQTATAQQLASDGTNAWVARATHHDVVRVDPSGVVTPIATVAQTSTITAIALDSASGELYFGTSDGAVSRVKADGSSQPESVTCWTTPIAALAVDGVSVYMLAGDSASDVLKIAK